MVMTTRETGGNGRVRVCNGVFGIILCNVFVGLELEPG